MAKTVGVTAPSRDRIQPNYLWISDEIDSCVPKNDFWKKI
jgi:hypothetical protein